MPEDPPYHQIIQESEDGLNPSGDPLEDNEPVLPFQQTITTTVCDDLYSNRRTQILTRTQHTPFPDVTQGPSGSTPGTRGAAATGRL